MARIENFNLINFMKRFKDGARPNMFAVDVALPTALNGLIQDGPQAEQNFRFTCKASSIPESTIDEIAVPFMGAEYKIPGDRKYAGWSVSVLNDSDFLIRDMFEQWHDSMVGFVNHDRVDVLQTSLDAMGTGTINQLNRNRDIIKTYKVIGIWPTKLGSISIDWENGNRIEEFDVDFAVQWVEPLGLARNTTMGGE